MHGGAIKLAQEFNKLHSYPDLIIASDIELEEEKELVIVNTVDNTETIIEMEFYNENS